MTNIYDLANELERGIRALPEYKTLVEKKEAIAADAEASALFKEFTDFQEDFYAKMQAGTITSVAIAAWSVPGCHNALYPCILL